MVITAPVETEYPEYFKTYTNLVLSSSNVYRELENQVLAMKAFISEVPDGMEDYAYAEGKWSIKQVIGHIIDTERIMAYRVLCFARNDKTELPGFEENDYVKNAAFEKRRLNDLAHEFSLVREANLAMFKSFDAETLLRTGIANGKKVSVRALIYIMAGHSLHHMNVIRKKYLVDLE